MRKILITLVLAASATAAEAIPIQFNFTITGLDPQLGFPAGPVADGFGFVVFDPDVFAPAGGEGRVQDSINGLPTLDLSVDWLGQHFDETSASLWMVEFFGGEPVRWGLGGRANTCGVPISTFGCLSERSSDFEITALTNDSGIVAMTLDGIPGYAFGTVTLEQVSYNSVPEPATLGLLAFGIAGMGLIRRRRKAP